MEGHNSFSIGLNIQGKYYSGDSSQSEGSETRYRCEQKVNDVLGVMNLQLIHYINIVTKGKWNHFEMAHYIVRAEYQADKTGVYSHEPSAFQFPDV